MPKTQIVGYSAYNPVYTLRLFRAIIGEKKDDSSENHVIYTKSKKSIYFSAKTWYTNSRREVSHMKVLNFGSLNLDFVYSVCTLARPGETVHAHAREQFCGGKGLNQSIALARAGLPVFHAGCVGEDGAPLKALLAENGVDTRHIRTLPGSSGHAVIQVEESGENNIILYGGANRAVEDTHIRETLADFSAGDVLVLQNEVNHLDLLLSLAKKQGLRVVFNPAPFTREVCALPLNTVDYLFVNETEGKGLSGETEPQQIADVLYVRYGCAVILTLGKDGARYRDGSSDFLQPIFPAKAVDATGAGDTFTGFFLAAAFAGQSPQEAMALAARASAITVSRLGAAQSIPFLAEV